MSETMANRSRQNEIDQLSEAMHNLQKSLVCTIWLGFEPCNKCPVYLVAIMNHTEAVDSFHCNCKGILQEEHCINLELMIEPTKTRCGHSFCKSCISKVLRKKSASCPLCNKSLNRRNISKDDHLQLCIGNFKTLVTAIEKDSHIDILSHLKQPRDTKESCPSPRQSSRDSNEEKSYKKKKSIHQSNQNASKQIDRPSTSYGMIDCDNPRYDSNVSNKPEFLWNPSFSDDENDNVTLSSNKIRTWLHSFPDKLSTNDWNAENEMPTEDRARPMNPISDDNSTSDGTGEVHHDGIASRRSSLDRKRSADCPKRIDEDDTLSQVNKEAKQIGEVIEIDSAASKLKYSARLQPKKSEKIARSRADIEKTVNQDNPSSSMACDRIATSSSLSTTNTSATTEQSTANWSRVIEFGKEMKRPRRKVKKLNVSTEKKKKPLQIVENITLTPSSRFDSAKIAAVYNKDGKEANISNRESIYNKNGKEANISNRESNDGKQDAIDKSLNLSDAKEELLNEMTNSSKLYDKEKTDSSKSTYTAANASYITLEEGRRIRIMNLNSDQMNQIIGLENAVDYHDSLSSSQKKLTVLTPEKLNESVDEIIRNTSQTSADNFRSSSCLSAEKRTPEPRETSNVQNTSSGAVPSRSSTPNKGRLSLRRKPETGDKKDVDSPQLSQLPLSYRLSIGKHKEDDDNRKSVDLPVSIGGELVDRLKVVKRDLNFTIREDQQQTDRDTVPANKRLKSVSQIEDSDGNVSGIVRQDEKFSNFSIGKSTASKKSVSTKSRNVGNQGYRSRVNFMQLGTLIRRRNIKYFSLGSTKQELSMPAEVRITPVYNMQRSVSGPEIHAATSPNSWSNSQNFNITVVENIYFANNMNQAVSKEFSAISSNCEALTTSTPKRNSNLNQKNSATIVRSSDANQRLDKSIENVAEKNERSLHKMSRADKSTIHGTISHTRPGPSNSIKLLSPDKDSQLKFLEIDSPSEREKLRRASSIKSAIKGNNFSEMESSRLAASMPDMAQEPFNESPRKKRKRMRCASDRELFEDGSSDRNDDSGDSVSDSSRSTIKYDKYSKLSRKARSSRLDANKKRRLSSPNDQDIDVIPSVDKEQDAPDGKKSKMSSSDTESESAMPVTKNLKRRSYDQYSQRNASTTEVTMKKCLARQDSDEDHRMRNIIDKWSNEHEMQKNLTKESKSSQNNVKSMRSLLEENSAGHQSSHSSNALEKRKYAKSSQKSSARESDMFESNSLFNSENLDYILQQQPTKLCADDASKKIVDSSNDDIINRVLQIDQSRNNADSTPRNNVASQREKDSKEYLLQDNFDEIIACVEQPQSEDFIPCTEQPDRNPNRPLAKQKTSNCLAMTDESCGAMQETPIRLPSSTNDMFEYHSPRNVRRSSITNTISRNSDKENIACSQNRHGYVGDQRDRKDATTNADAIDKDSRKKIVSKHNVSREKEKLLEERNTSIRSAGRHVDDDEMQREAIAGNRSNSKDDSFEHDSLMNFTQHQIHLQMYEKDLFGTTTRNQTKATKMISRDDSFPKEQCTPRKKKLYIQDKNTGPEERFADEDDVVENTPEKKMKNSGNNVKTIESRESTKIKFLSPISRTSEWTPRSSPIGRGALQSGAITSTIPFGVCPFSQSTPIAQNSIITTNRPEVFEGSKKIERIESGSILLTKPVNTKTLENVRRQSDRQDLCFVCSGLSAIQIAIVKEFAAKYNANYVNQFNRDVTHVIVNTTGEQNAAKSTLKYLQGIAHRKWIVSYRWIEDCNRQQRLLNEVPYEATTQNDSGIDGAGPRNSRLRERGLFEGFTFLCVGPYDNVSLAQYQDLLLVTGATVAESFEIFIKMGGIKGIVVQDNNHNDETIEHWYQTANAAPILVGWIVECIGYYKLLPLSNYILLSSKDCCAIGYPRELMEKDEEDSDDE